MPTDADNLRALARELMDEEIPSHRFEECLADAAAALDHAAEFRESVGRVLASCWLASRDMPKHTLSMMEYRRGLMSAIERIAENTAIDLSAERRKLEGERDG